MTDKMNTMNFEYSTAAARRILDDAENFDVNAAVGAVPGEEQTSITEEELKYSELLSEVIESGIFTDEQNHEVSLLISNLQENTYDFAKNSEAVIGTSNANAIYRGISKKIVAILKSAKYHADFKDTPIEIAIGSTKVDVTTSPDEVLLALRFMSEAICELSHVPIDAHRLDSVRTAEPNLELGYVAGTDDKVLMITKAEHDNTPHPTVRGRSPRINFAIGIGGIKPSTTAV